MSDIVRYSTLSTPNPITDYRKSVNTPDFQGQQNVLINPDLSAISGQPMKYWKHVSGAVQLMTQAERDAVDSALAAAALGNVRLGAKNEIVGTYPLSVLLRAMADVLLSEVNILRGWTVSFKAATAAATSLANLQTRVAALSDLPDRTLAQVKTAIQNEIDSGIVDS